MTQPLDRSASIPQIGDLDVETGEFWREHTFEMGRGNDNLSAYEANRMFLNLDGKQFLDCSFGSGCDIDADSRSVVAADFSRDGGTDLLVGSVGGGPLRLFANQLLDGNHSIRIDLEGKKSNRQGIGSRVVATVGGKRIIRDLFPTNGCLGQGPAELLMGVGSATNIDQLEIRWPDGTKQSFDNISVDGVVTVTEGSDAIRFTSYADAQKNLQSKAKRAFASIDQPKFDRSTECDLAGNERVLGIHSSSNARAYPLRYMQAHQVCHDELAGQPVLISYCPPAGAGTAFLRTVNNGGKQTTLNFAVAGMIESAGYTVLRDDKTKSIWNPLTGQCVAGPLKGKKMQRVSLLTTTWDSWKQLNPQSDVLTGPQTSYPEVILDGSNSGSKYVSGVSTACAPDTFGLGIRGSKQQLFVPLDSMSDFRGGLVSGRLDNQTVVVFFDVANETAQCYYSTTNSSEPLKFSTEKSKPGRYVADDGSVFDFLGRCQTGPRQGQHLTPVSDSTLIRWFAWNKTFTKSMVVRTK